MDWGDPDPKQCKLGTKTSEAKKRVVLFTFFLMKTLSFQPHSEEISDLTEEGEPLPEPPHKNPVLQPHSEKISGLTEEGEPFPEPPHKNPVLQPH